MSNKIRVPGQIICLFILFFIILDTTGCSRSKQQDTAEVIPVIAMRIIPQDIKEILAYTGDVKAQDEAVIYPKVNGKIIEKLKEDGSHVNKGDIIAYIDRDEVGFEFNKAPVESPLTGTIGRVYVDRGTNVGLQSPIALVVNMDKVKIELDIPGKYLPRVVQGQIAEVNVDAYPAEVFIGKVSRISPVVDLDTRTAPIEIMIDNPEHYFKPGMFARVRLILNERKAVPVILKEAILGKGLDTYVYIADKGIAHKRDVKLGIRQGAYFEITEGLEEGELVVVMGQQRLYDEAKVSLEGDEQ
jgi:membrane fusion protein, multidrug efflux system